MFRPKAKLKGGACRGRGRSPGFPGWQASQALQLINGLERALQSFQGPAALQPTSPSANLPALLVLSAQPESLAEELSFSAHTPDAFLCAERRRRRLPGLGPHNWKGNAGRPRCRLRIKGKISHPAREGLRTSRFCG